MAASRGRHDVHAPLPDALHVTELAPLGFAAFTTTRHAGSFGVGSPEPVTVVHDRWDALLAACTHRGAPGLASSRQVHGDRVVVHDGGWQGWLRGQGADGHATADHRVALAVTIADCTPVFLVHPGGACALLHAGWRGTAAGILTRGLETLARLGAPADELTVHLGPSICGRCYEVGPEVLHAVTGRPATRPGHLDVRAVLAEQAQARGVRALSVSTWCTRCHQDQLYTHRGGDDGRQLAVLWHTGHPSNSA
jgi:YfiH family protein